LLTVKKQNIVFYKYLNYIIEKIVIKL
jgi:hypothetical protein